MQTFRKRSERPSPEQGQWECQRNPEQRRQQQQQQQQLKASAVGDVGKDIECTTMEIYTIQSDVNEGGAEPQDPGIEAEDIKVLSSHGSVAFAFIMVFGLLYALGLGFPGNLKYTFKFLQMILMNLDGHKLNTHTHSKAQN